MEKERIGKLVDAINLAGFEITEIKEEYQPWLAPGNPQSFSYGKKTGAVLLRITPVEKS